MRKIRYVPQFIQTECGLCCITMIANYYGHKITLNELRDYQQPGRDGISAKDLCRILDWIQFDYKLYKCSIQNIPRTRLPLIAFWEKSHFIVVERIQKKTISVVDPALGRVIYSYDDFEMGFSGLVICPSPKPNIALKSKPKNVWLKYLPLLFSSKFFLLGVLVFSIVTYLISLLIPVFVQKIIDSVNSIPFTLMCGGMLILFGYVVSFLVNSLFGVLLRTKIYKSFYKSTFAKLTNVAYSFFENRTVGSISYNLDCIDVINDLYGSRLINFIISVGAFVVLSAYVMSISMRIYGVLFIALSLLSLIMFLSNKHIVRLNQTEINGKEKLRELQLEYISAVGCIKMGGAQKEFFQKWNKKFEQTIDKTKKKGIAQTVYTTISAASLTVLPVFILLICLYSVFLNQMTVGTAVSLYSIATVITSNAIDMVSSANQFELFKLYLERIKDIVAQPDESNGSIEIKDINLIEFRNVSFRYNTHSPLVLKNINMKFEKGKKIAIVGGSGSGKSSIAKLLIQLYPPSEGSIIYDDVIFSELDKTALRKCISMVPQDGTIFNRSIMENITLLADDCSEEDITATCKAMQIYDDIIAMPMKFDTILSDIGTNISGGQKQRLILARMLLAKPHFIVMDEATSSLDSITEQLVFSELSRLGLTQIIIAHRLSTIEDADNIYVLKDGEIVEEGQHHALMQRRGVYYELYQSSQQNKM